MTIFNNFLNHMSYFHARGLYSLSIKGKNPYFLNSIIERFLHLSAQPFSKLDAYDIR